jgi:DNA-binding NtrC family response regulator
MSRDRSGFRILVVDDEPEIVRDLVDLLGDEGYSARGALSGIEAQGLLQAAAFDLLLCDLRMPPPDGLAVVRWVKNTIPDLPVIMLTALTDPAMAREAIQAGCLDYLVKPWNSFELLLRVRRVHEHWDLVGQRERLLRWIEHLNGEDGRDESLENLVGRSQGMRRVFDLIRRVAASDANVLLRGESGTGKSVLAAAVHRLSPRRNHPFLKVNCGAIPEHLLESELFGHERGAFTGAVRQKPGLFEVVEGGTLLLDEIGDMTMPVQVKVLQAIEEKSFLRVGGTESIQADVRILAATHQDLEEAILRGDFREDLYYRLNVFPIQIPPLRERREDIPLLLEHFLTRRKLGLAKISPEALRLLVDHAFPGNIRELENLVERALILAGETPLTPEHFPSLQAKKVQERQLAPQIPDQGVSLEEMERGYIVAALQKTGGNKSRAAQLLGMTRRTLYSRMERHGIPI